MYDALAPEWRAAMAYADAITPVEITSVITLFNYFNRFAVALRIPVTR